MKLRLALLLPLLLAACGGSTGGGTTPGADTAIDAEGDSFVDDGSVVPDTTAGDTTTLPDSTSKPDTHVLDAPPPPPSSPITLDVFPDDGKTVITKAIKAATKSVHVEVYLLTDSYVVDALVAAKGAGREVSVLLEKSPYPDLTANQSAYDTLKAGGVNVAWTTGLYQLTHAKLMIIDAATAYIMTLNLTASGVLSNREYAAIDTDPADVAEAEQIFAADFASYSNPKLTGILVVSPLAARAPLTALIDSATKSIDLEMEELSDATIVGHLVAELGKGIAVRVIVPSSGRSAGTDAQLAALKAKGAQIKTLSTPAVHAKIIVVDAARLYVGSVNLTKASLEYNREVGVISDSAAAVARAEATIGGDFGKGAAY